MIPEDYAALIHDGERLQPGRLPRAELPDGELLVRVAYSSLNYKDGLASLPGGGSVVRRFPLVPGIDLAGTVAVSRSGRFKPGDMVVATGYELGTARNGGYGEYAIIPATWAVPLPSGLTAKSAMVLGTAGLTAALAIHRLEHNGLTPAAGEVLVTGASGGVGSMAVAMLARAGYRVAACTGKAQAHEALRSWGATRILAREELQPQERKPLEKQRFAAAIDPVGGEPLGYVLASLAYGGSAAVTGLTGGAQLPTTVYPFILRGVSLLGIDSVSCPQTLRERLWADMARCWESAGLERLLSAEITLEQVPEYAANIRRGELSGRTVVRLTGG